MNITVNPDYSRLVPELSESEFESLKESIRQNGLWIPIIINKDGVILDGYHRYHACIHTGTTVNTIQRNFNTPLDEEKFILEVNAKRRQLGDLNGNNVQLSLKLDDIKINQEYAKLVPPLSKIEYAQLKSSIRTNGLYLPIIINENNTILDGHHRYQACSELEVQAKYKVKKFENILAEKKFVILINLNRRHLLDYQKGILAKELLKIEQEEAVERQSESGEKYGENHPKSFPKGVGNLSNHDNESMSITAKKVGLRSGEQLRKILKIEENAPEELKDKVRTGQTSINYAYKTVNRKEKKKNALPIPTGHFDVILADPPWKYDINTRGSPDDHYDVMDDSDISKLVIPSADNCVLFLWGTAPKLPEALQVIADWGFTYKTNMVWIKDKIGTGYYFRGKHELLLVAVKGKPLIPEEADRPESVLIAPRTTHSKKPEEIYDIIERMYPDAKYLELFARNTRSNWKSWGNEIA